MHRRKCLSSAGNVTRWVTGLNSNREFIERWIAKGGWQGPIREMQTAMVLRMIPQFLDALIRVLDLGAGYGVLAVAVLRDRPKATALCLDASAEMLKLGRERNTLGHRIE